MTQGENSPFCKGATTARDHVCDLDVVAVKRDGAHSKVEVAVVDERSILRSLPSSFQGFGELGFFRGAVGPDERVPEGTGEACHNCPHEFHKLDNLLLERHVGAINSAAGLIDVD
jgi:hypothetical protein